jgi:hypothetical protein
MGDEGIERTALPLSKRPISENPAESGTQNGTLNGENTPIDLRLARLNKAWPTLPDEAQVAILRIAGV